MPTTTKSERVLAEKVHRIVAPPELESDDDDLTLEELMAQLQCDLVDDSNDDDRDDNANVDNTNGDGGIMSLADVVAEQKCTTYSRQPPFVIGMAIAFNWGDGGWSHGVIVRHARPGQKRRGMHWMVKHDGERHARPHDFDSAKYGKEGIVGGWVCLKK